MNLKVKCPDDVRKKHYKSVGSVLLKHFTLDLHVHTVKKGFYEQYHDVCSQTRAVRDYAPEICLFNPAPARVRWVH